MIFGTTSANHPGEGITLRQNRSTNHFQSHDVMAPRLGRTNFWRYPLLGRFGITNREPRVGGTLVRYSWTK